MAKQTIPQIHTITGQVTNQALKIPVEIASHWKINQPKAVNAILDTGAGLSVISGQLAKDLRLKAMEGVDANTVGEIRQMLLYSLRLGVAGKHFGIKALAADGISGMLLDIDVISKGRLSVGSGEFEFSRAG